MSSRDLQINLLIRAIYDAKSAFKKSIDDMKKVEKVKDEAERKDLLRNRARITRLKADEQEIKNIRAKTNATNAALRASQTHDHKVSESKRKLSEITQIQINKSKIEAGLRTKALKDEKEIILNNKKNIGLAKEREALRRSELKIEQEFARTSSINSRLRVQQDREQSYFGSKDIRQNQQNQRNARRASLQRYTDLSHAQESARAAMMYVSTPAAANAALAIRNAMTMEQMGIRMRTQFGKEEGMKAFEEMKDYAATTAFRLQEAVQLLSGMKVGQKGLGINNTQELVEKSKSIGNVLLSYASSPEGRSEIAYQLSQVAMKRKANMRQDLMVMANYGLPIFEILEKQTGKSLEQLKDIYGAEIPSNIVFGALESLSKSPAVSEAKKERANSLSQSWDTLKERAFFTSATYGDVLDKQLGIKQAFGEASTALKNIEANMRGISKDALSVKEQVIGFTTAMVVGVPVLTFAALSFKKMFTYAAQTSGSVSALYRTLGLAGSVVSGIYLSTLDWDETIKDIDKNGFKGLLKHMDALIAGAQILSTLMMFAFPGGFLVKGAGKILGFAGKKLLKSTIGTSIGAASLGVGAYFGGRELREKFDDYLEKLRAEEYIEELSKNTPQMTPIPNSTQAGIKAVYDAATKPQWNVPDQPINLTVENNFKMDETGKVTSSTTKVKRSPYDNPITQIWEQ